VHLLLSEQYIDSIMHGATIKVKLQKLVRKTKFNINPNYVMKV